MPMTATCGNLDFQNYACPARGQQCKNFEKQVSQVVNDPDGLKFSVQV